MEESRKEEIQALVNKVQILEFVLGTLNVNHKEYADRIEKQYKQASNHKLKLTEEILRLTGARELETGLITPPQGLQLS